MPASATALLASSRPHLQSNKVKVRKAGKCLELLSIYDTLYTNAEKGLDKFSSQTASFSCLEAYQDFTIRRIRRKFLQWGGTRSHDISTGKGTTLLRVKRRSRKSCWPFSTCFLQRKKKYTFYDGQNVAVIQLTPAKVSGYLSKKLNFIISSPRMKSRLGEICKIECLMDQPKYEVRDPEGNVLFTLPTKNKQNDCSSQAGNGDEGVSYQILGKYGKIGCMEMQRKPDSYHLLLYQFCSGEEKILLISLILAYDLIEKG